MILAEAARRQAFLFSWTWLHGIVLTSNFRQFLHRSRCQPATIRPACFQRILLIYLLKIYFFPLTDRFAGAMMEPQTDSARDGGVTGNHAAPQKTTQSGGPCPVPGRRNADPCQGSSAQDPPTTRRRCSAGIRPGPHTEPVESTSRQRWFVLVAAVCQPPRPMHPGGEGRERRALRTAECQ